MSTPQQPNSQTYTQGFGSSSLNVQTPHLDIRNPSSTDVVGFPVGKRWVNTVGDTTWTLTSFSASAGITSATWVAEGGGSSALATLSGNTGTATPSAGNIQIAGAAGITTAALGSTVTISLSGGSTAIDSFVPDAGTNPVVPTAAGAVTMAGTAAQITTTGGTNTLTFSLPAAITAPGSLATTTSLTAGNGFTVTTGGATITGATLINTTGAGITTIGTGGTGATLIGNATGNTSVTGSLGSTTGITAGTTLTATLGNIQATNGNLVLSTAGNKISIQDGANASVGTSGAMTGGAVTVNTTAVSANSLIFCVPAALGTVAAPQAYYISAKVAATSFTITSADATDTSTWNYWIIN